MSSQSASLAGEAVIHLRGADIPRFLQGQLTCDTRRLTPQRAVAGSMCNVQGRVISDLWVVQVDPGHCLLRLRRSLAEAFATNLERYARFSRIQVIVDERGDAVRGAWGDLDAESVPREVGACHADGGVLCLRTGPRTAEWILADDSREARADAATDETSERALEWDAEHLLAGHYALEVADSGTWTPQALNYDRTGRVAFDKGCYTGQEVVARLHYRGQSKRRLRIGILTQGAAPARGERLLDSVASAAGEVMRCAVDTQGRCIVAAMVLDASEGPLRLEDGRGVATVA